MPMTEYEEHLFSAIGNEDTEALQQLLDSKPDGLDVTDVENQDGYNLIEMAIGKRSLSMARQIILAGFDFSRFEDDQVLAETVLSFSDLMATERITADYAELVLDHKFPAEFTFYRILTRNIDEAVLRTWIEHMDLSKLREEEDAFSYKDLIEENDEKTIAFLLEAGLNPNQQLEEEDEFHPIIECILAGNWRLTELFLKHGAEWPRIDKQVLSSIVRSRKEDNEAFWVIWRLAYREDEETGLVQPIHCAVLLGQQDYVKTWLDGSNDPNTVFPKSNIGLIHLAVEVSNQEIVKLLLSNKADPNLNEWYPPLRLAFGLSNKEIINLLLESGANVSDTAWLLVDSFEGCVDLYSEEEIIEIFELCYIYNQDVNGWDILSRASEQDLLKVARWALERGADPTKDNSGVNAFDETSNQEMLILFNEFGFKDPNLQEE